MTDKIVAIDLGTSHITGIVGEKRTDGTFSVIACESVDPASCIRRGIIYNRDNTAMHVLNVIKKLESYMKGDFIDKVYIGVNGQSLHTIDHVEVKEIAEGAAVTNEDIEDLKRQCEVYNPDLQDVLDIAPAVYYIDGHKDTNPVGVPGKKFEARYKLVVGRSSIRRDIIKSINEIAKKELAGLIVSPLALADAILSKEEKELGCALVDFGAGVTSVSVYKNGNLIHMSVIPLGGNLITRDITSLQLVEAEAEKIKKENGSAILQKEDEDETIFLDTEGSNREIAVKDLNAIIEGRAKEIVENVYARINDVMDFKYLPSGIVITGGASELRNLPELIKDRCNVPVRPSTIRSGLVRDFENMLGNPTYMTAVSLMLKGTESCVTHQTVLQSEDDSQKEDDKEDTRGGFFRRKKNEPKENKPGKEEKNKKSGNFWGTFFDEN